MTPDVVTSQPAQVATTKNSTKTGKHNERRRRTARFQHDSNRNAGPYWFTARAAAQTVGVQDLATLLLTMKLSSSSQDARNWPSLRGGASHIYSRVEGSAVSTAFFLVREGLQGLIMAADVGPRQPDDEAASRLFGTQNGKRAQCEGVSFSNQNLDVPR